MAYRLAPQAEADLEDIAFYTFLESGSQDIAERLVDFITERFDLLDAYPSVGRRREALRPGLRAFPVGKYLVFYRVESNGRDVSASSAAVAISTRCSAASEVLGPRDSPSGRRDWARALSGAPLT